MVHTHPTNVSKRPAQVVLDTKQKRWTTAQVKEDRACTEKEQEEQDQKAKQAITQVAAAHQKAVIQQENTVSAKKPQPHPTGKGTAATSSHAHVVAVNDNEDEDSQVLGQRKRIQKTDHHDAVNAVRTANQPSHPCAPDAAGNGNKLTWIESTPFKAPLHLESASSLSHPIGSAISRVTHATTNTTTTATAPPATPESSVFNDDVEIEDHTPDSAEGPKHLAVYTLTKMGKPKHIQKSMDVIEVKDVS
ncbi:hypothetical protein F4604DRAFT_1929092 [Suillus subluteus]|nr:hypothetical protein F4604DRAFT_1929092 [Suillus subluteus]